MDFIIAGIGGLAVVMILLGIFYDDSGPGDDATAA